MAGTITRIGPKHQVTIPREIFEKLRLAIGEYLEVGVKNNRIFMTPKKLVPKDQEWFYTQEWQAKEAEADKDIAQGRLDGPFESAEELTVYLNSLKKPRS